MIGPYLIPSPHPPGAFVLDVSVTAAWLFTTRGTTYTARVLNRFPRTPACVPECWAVQVAEAARAGERRGLKTAAQVDYFLTGLSILPIFVEDDTTARAWPDILAVARAHNLSVADAAYLELALRLNLPLATADPALTRAAAAAGDPVFTP